MLAKLAYHNVISLFSHQLNKEGIAKLLLIAFERFHRSLTFDENPLLLGVCGFESKVKSRYNHPKIDQTDSFATPSEELNF